jgi:hypothetical protein
MPIFIVENMWLKMFGHVLESPGCVSKWEANGLTCHPFILAKTMEQFVMPTLDSCVTTTDFLNLWMSKFGHNMIVLVINFINSQWVPYYVTIGLFKAIDTSRV